MAASIYASMQPTFRQGGTPVPSGGTSATRYSFAGSRFRLPSQPRAISASNTFLVGQFVFGSPAYDTTNPRFYMPGFYQTLSAVETNNPNQITIEGVSIRVGGVWYQATGFPITIDPTTAPGALLPAITGVTIPANTVITARVAYSVPTTGNSLPATTRNPAFGEGIQGSTSTLAARLMDGIALNNTGGHADAYQPLYMIAQGGDGRPAFILIGDSIGFGANESGSFNASVSNWSTRGAFGYICRGLDDDTTSKRLMVCNLGVPGSRPLDIATRDGAYSKKKLDAIKAAFDATGDWPFDEVISQHGTNSVSSGTTGAQLIAGMQTYLAILKAEWSKPITQVELLAKAQTTDGFATLANETVLTQDAYPAGQRWQLNAAIGTNGLPDPAATLRASGHIQDSFAPWLDGSYDTGSNRDKLRLLPFNTTLAASAVQNAASFSMTAAPTVGAYLNIAYTGGYADGHVLTVTGAGPYTVAMIMTSQVGVSGAPSGAVVREQFHALDGTHPGGPAHRDTYGGISTVAWKQRRGWT